MMILAKRILYEMILYKVDLSQKAETRILYKDDLSQKAEILYKILAKRPILFYIKLILAKRTRTFSIKMILAKRPSQNSI